MFLALFGNIVNFIKEFIKTLVIDTFVGLLLSPIGI